jgi:MFS family permease
MLGCLIFTIGVIMEIISTTIPLMAAGRFIAGLGVGFESAVVILYMSEICPRKVRGALIACYQFCITIGILLASVVVYATQNRMDSGSYRIPVAIQLLWALILGVGIFFLPESPRYFVKKGEHEKAAKALASVRGQPEDSQYVTEELAEIIANHEYELSVVPQGSYFSSWANCFKGSLWKANSNLRRTILGTSLQMMQQWTGVNFIFFFGTTFFQQLVSFDSFPILISMMTNTTTGHDFQPLPHRSHHHPRQRSFHSHLILDHRALRSSSSSHLGCPWHAHLPVPHCNPRYCPPHHKPGRHPGSDRLHLSRHLLLRLDLGSRRLGLDW